MAVCSGFCTWQVVQDFVHPGDASKLRKVYFFVEMVRDCNANAFSRRTKGDVLALHIPRSNLGYN